jgi:hypothetical protein
MASVVGLHSLPGVGVSDWLHGHHTARHQLNRVLTHNTNVVKVARQPYLEEHGLAASGLAGDDVQSRVEVDSLFVDEGEVANAHLAEVGGVGGGGVDSPLSFSSFYSTPAPPPRRPPGRLHGAPANQGGCDAGGCAGVVGGAGVGLEASPRAGGPHDVVAAHGSGRRAPTHQRSPGRLRRDGGRRHHHPLAACEGQRHPPARALTN